MATTETLEKEAPEGVAKQYHQLFHVRSSRHYTVDVLEGGEMEGKTFTRATTVIISVVDGMNK